jgi:hypothetical protein
MLVKDQIISELDLIETPDLLRIYEFISTIRLSQKKTENMPKRKKNYLKVRAALKNIKTSLSEFIIIEREDRL